MSPFIPSPLFVRPATKVDCMFSQSGSMWVLYNEDIFNDAISVTLVVRLSALACNDSPSKNTMRLSDFPLPIWISGIGDSTSWWSGAALWTIPWISFDTTGVNSLAPSLPKLGDFCRQEVMQRKSTSRVHCSRTQRPLLKVVPPPPKKTCQPITSPHFSIIRPNSNPYPLTKNLTFFSFSTASFFFVHLIECKISSLFITSLTASTFFLNKTLNITPLNLLKTDSKWLLAYSYSYGWVSQIRSLLLKSS